MKAITRYVIENATKEKIIVISGTLGIKPGELIEQAIEEFAAKHGAEITLQITRKLNLG